jgi:predicted ArsR family transcriptional regulator
MPHAYDGLAEDALRFLAASGGPESVRAFARTRAGDMQRRYEAELGRAPSAQRTQALATALTTDGYAATVEAVGTGMQVCQHHCPVQHVAEQFPQLCEAETEVFSRLLGVHVQRLATIAHGDGVCTTHVPSVPVSRAVPARATTTQGSRRTKV